MVPTAWLTFLPWAFKYLISIFSWQCFRCISYILSYHDAELIIYFTSTEICKKLFLPPHHPLHTDPITMCMLWKNKLSLRRQFILDFLELKQNFPGCLGTMKCWSLPKCLNDFNVALANTETRSYYLYCLAQNSITWLDRYLT